MARLVIDRALNGKASNPWPRWEEMLGVGAAADLREHQRALQPDKNQRRLRLPDRRRIVMR